MNKLSSSGKGTVMFRSYRNAEMPARLRRAGITLNSVLDNVNVRAR
jgi:hypothetical protein